MRQCTITQPMEPVPRLVQPYLKKCFEGIHKISFDKGGKISEMISGQTEVVPLIRTFHPDDHNNQVEVWLTVLETAMCDTIRDVCKRATTDFEGRPRGEWLKEWPGQAVLATCQMVWTKEVCTLFQSAARQCHQRATGRIQLRDGKPKECSTARQVIPHLHLKGQQQPRTLLSALYWGVSVDFKKRIKCPLLRDTGGKGIRSGVVHPVKSIMSYLSCMPMCSPA